MNYFQKKKGTLSSSLDLYNQPIMLLLQFLLTKAFPLVLLQ
jgi:hypothetical protein